MPEGHTTIGAEHFHFRVRNGIGWFLLAITAREFGSAIRTEVALRADYRNLDVVKTLLKWCRNQKTTTMLSNSLGLYG